MKTPRVLLALLVVSVGCSRPAAPVALAPGQLTAKADPLALTSSADRASRRAFDGAPPVIPHPQFNVACIACHDSMGRPAPPVGIAVANPHTQTPGLSDASRCRQCHVFQKTTEEFRASTFAGLSPGRRNADRAYQGAPPTVPHRRFMREACTACHSGPGARPELVCKHADRSNCQQCHVQSDARSATPFPPDWSTSRSKGN